MTTYAPPPHVAIVLGGKLATDKDVVFWCEAAKIQARDHICPTWNWRSTNVAFYSPKTFISRAEGMIIAVVDDDGNDDAAGFHNLLGGFVDLHQSDIPSGTLSHELAEMLGNARLDRWFRAPNGIEWAGELCDAVQRDTYHIPVTLYGQRRNVPVSNFVLPAYFDKYADGPYDWMGLLTAPLSMSDGGYSIIRNNGVIDYLSTSARADADAKRKMQDMTGRTRTGRLAAMGVKR